jgi:hypothetical protein
MISRNDQLAETETLILAKDEDGLLSTNDFIVPANKMTRYVLVSHADVLQIAQLYKAQLDKWENFHRFGFKERTEFPVGVRESGCYMRLTSSVAGFPLCLPT